MRRWHAERELMLSRWRQEIAKHANGDPLLTGAVVFPPTPGNDDCHCFRGAGFMRKRRAFGCGRPRCGLCHPHKRWPRPHRLAQVTAAVAYEWDASGGWP